MANQTNTYAGEHYEVVKRISWGAIIAGTLVALVIQMTLSMLGLGIGLGVMDPNAQALSGVGIGAGIWLVVSTLVSLYIGGFMAGRLAGIPAKGDGFLNGIVVWALATLLTLYLATSVVGGAISGVTGILGQGLQVAGQSVKSVAPEAAETIKKNPGQARQEANQAIDQAQQQYRQMRRQAEQALSGAGKEVKQTTKQVAPIASGAAFGGFIALLLGALAAAFGGMSGAPKDMAVGGRR
ncbi:MAG: hypothetical protein ACR2KU_03810 [Gammaproteobacteria bacterium]|nr:hypothetical protein [Gammaproteobacteria bacterium]MBA3731876.1 hypothetical protein [Gammaproteobacteria bacterium]